MGLLNIARKSIVGTFSVVIGLAAIAVSAGSFISSKSQYNDYLEEYEAQQEKLKGDVPQLPKSVLIDNSYVTYSGSVIASTKSSYKNNYVLSADMASIAALSDSKSAEIKKIDNDSDEPLNNYITALDRTGGAITFKIKAVETGYADVAIDMASHWLNASGEIIEIENITDQIKIQFNKLEVKTEALSLPALSEQASEFTTLVLKDVLLLKGTNALTFTTSAYNPYKVDNANAILYVMPDIKNVSVMSSVEINLPEVTK